MRKRKNNKYLLLLILLLGITLGYALISTTLKINGTANILKQTWSVYWDTPVVTEGSVSTTAPTRTNDEGDPANTKLIWTVDLALPGDYYEFTVDAVNAGTIDAMITGINNTVTPTLPEYIKYDVTYADGVAIKENHLLAKQTGTNPTTEKYKVRVYYDETVATASTINSIPEGGNSYTFTFNVTYGQADEDAISTYAWRLPEGKTKDNLQVGDEICSRDQCFNFIKYDGQDNDIVMLAKYNLKVGNIYEYDGKYTKTGEYTSSDTGYGLQSSEARGYTDSSSTFNGTVAFSSTIYWMDDNSLKSPYNENDTIYYDSSSNSFKYRSDDSRTFPTIYDATNYKGAPGELDEHGHPTNPNYSIAYYVDGYKTKLTEYGVTIKDTRLLTYSEAIDSSIGCSESSGCPTTGFITNASFWLGSASKFNRVVCLVWFVGTDGTFRDSPLLRDLNFGVRPVVVIDKANL